MGIEPEDNAGPPPDPTDRTWRHPSEIAAANAFAQREAERAQRRRSTWSVLVGGATGVALCVGVLALVAGVGIGDDPARPQLEPVGEAAASAAAAGVVSTQLLGSPAATSTSTSTTATSVADAAVRPAASMSLPDALDGFDAAGIHLVLAGSEPIANAVAVEVTGSSELGSIAPDGLAVPTTVAAEIEQEAATSSSTTTPADPATLERLLLSSASATEGQDDLAVVIDGVERPAVVVASDRYTDVAVLGVWALASATATDPEATDDAATSDASTTSTVATVSTTIEVATTERSVDPSAGDVVLIAGHDAPRLEHLGRLVSTGSQSIAVDGHPLIDILSTSARLPDAGAGSALCDAGGTIIGLVVQGDSQLAVAVPIERAADTAVALLRHGWAGGGHLGIEGRAVDAGIELTAVAEAGPAAEAGFQPGDILTAVDGVAIDDFAGLITVLRDAVVGDTVVVSLERDGTVVEVTVTLGAAS